MVDAQQKKVIDCINTQKNNLNKQLHYVYIQKEKEIGRQLPKILRFKHKCDC